MTWLVSVKYILAQKDKSSELRNKLDCLRDRITADPVGIRPDQEPVYVPMIWIIWFVVSAILVNNVKIAGDEKLDDLVSALGELALCEPPMKGARDAFFNEIEREPKNVNGRGFPGAGKSVLAISIVIRLQNQNRHVISLQFDRTQSAITTTDAL